MQTAEQLIEEFVESHVRPHFESLSTVTPIPEPISAEPEGLEMEWLDNFLEEEEEHSGDQESGDHAPLPF